MGEKLPKSPVLPKVIIGKTKDLPQMNAEERGLEEIANIENQD